MRISSLHVVSYFVLLFILSIDSFASRTITAATLNGASTATVAVSDTVSAAVTASITTNDNTDRWRSTAWRVGNSGAYTCSDTSNHSGSGTYTNTFNITAPASAGTYPVNFITYSDGGCASNPSATYTMNNALTVYVDTTTYTQDRNFALRTSMNTRGDLKVTGNTILCKSSSGDSSGSCTAPGNNDANNGFYALYSDIDGDSSTFSSTSADLALPTGAKVLWAGLYWQGQFPTSFNTDKNTAKTVKFRRPGGSYQNIIASQFDYSGSAYQGFANVTSLMNTTSPNGTYYVANLTTQLGTSAYGAWTLSLIYQDDGDSLKNITIYDGFKGIFQSGSSQTIDVSGFRTPLSGTVASTFFIFAAEGDAAYASEGLQIKNGSGTFSNITNTLNPTNNPFNSNITYKNAYVTDRSPAWQNTAGIDIDTYDISGILGNNQTSTQIKLIGNNGDRYYCGAFGFATQIYSPTIGNFDKNVSVTYASNQTCGTDKDLRGATLNYEMSFENTGTEAASTVRVYDDFQSNGILDYFDMTQTTIPTVQLLSGTAASTITCDKNATAVYCDFNRINIGTKYKINFSTKVKSTLVIPDDISLSNTANAHYYNASTGEEITQLASSNMEVAGGICAVLPVANYRFDECSASGLQGDTLDSSGNNLNGMTVNSPFKVSGQICVGNKFSRNTYSNITIPHNSLLSQLNELSITAWINPLTIPSSDLYTIVSKDTNYEFHINTSGQIYWWWSNATLTGTSTIPTNTWSHVAITYKNGEQHVYINGVEDASSTHTGTLPQNTLPLYIGVDYNYPSRTFDGTIDEVKIFDRSLNQSEVLKIYTNELSGNNFNNTIRTCPDCAVTPDPAITFDAWDSFRSLSDRNISTKIVNKPFDLTIASINETNDGYQDFNGTLCARLIDNAGNTLTDWVKLTYASEQTKTASFILNRAIGGSDNAGVRLLWEKNALAATACDALTATDTTTASDRFAVRPALFTITAPNAIAGVDFNLTFTAPNFSGNASTQYNESAGSSFEVSVAEHNPLCSMGTFNPIPNSFSFINGTKIFTTRYSEVGVLDVNITDLTKACGAKYANIDCDDADVAGYYSAASDLPIGFTQAQIAIKPHHFDVTGTLSNFAGGNFTYLSDDLNMSSNLDLNITAKNGEGNTTTNYSSACYAKNTNLTLDHSTVPSPLTKILYTETLSTLNTTVLKADPWILTFNASLFNSGSVAPNIDLNFDRSPTKPLNPFDFNITSATATDADAVTGTGIPLGDTTFVFGRARAYDVTTNETSAPNPIEFEVYSSASNTFVSGMPQNVLKWYRNLDHDTAAAGNVISGGFNAGATDGAIDTSATPADGLQIVTVTSNIDRTVHLNISPWLWYSPKYSYNYSGDCSRHPCFKYDYTDASAGVQGVNSGTFQGSDFQMAPAKNITNKGVKLFR